MHQFEIGQSVEIMFAAINRVPIWRAGTVERVH
jgi:hypothetical protein